jgi:hypothetical protein
LSFLIGRESSLFLSENIIDLVKESSLILKKPTAIPVSNLPGNLNLSQNHKLFIHKSENISCLTVDMEDLDNMLSIGPNRYGRNYQYNPVNAFYRMMDK